MQSKVSTAWQLGFDVVGVGQAGVALPAHCLWDAPAADLMLDRGCLLHTLADSLKQIICGVCNWMKYHGSVKKIRLIHHEDNESQAVKEMSTGKGQHYIKLSLTFLLLHQLYSLLPSYQVHLPYSYHIYISPQP